MHKLREEKKAELLQIGSSALSVAGGGITRNRAAEENRSHPASDYNISNPLTKDGNSIIGDKMSAPSSIQNTQRAFG